MSDGTREKQDLRAGESGAEDIPCAGAMLHIGGKHRSEHHAEEYGHVGNDGMERHVIGAVLFRQVDIGERCDDGIHHDAEYVLQKPDDDVQPNGIRRDEHIHVIGDGLHQHRECECPEPIMLCDKFFPYFRKEYEKQEIKGVDGIGQRVLHAGSVQHLQYIRIERRVWEICGERIGGSDQDRQKKALVFDRKDKDIG